MDMMFEEDDNLHDTMKLPLSPAETDEDDEPDITEEEEEDDLNLWTIAPENERKQFGILRSLKGNITSYPVYECLNTIGRGEENMICIGMAGVSAKHAELYVTPSPPHYLFICDMGSTNGSVMKDIQNEYVLQCRKMRNGCRTWYQIQPGWTLCLGSAMCKVETLKTINFQEEERKEMAENGEDVDKVTSDNDEPAFAHSFRRFSETLPFHANTMCTKLGYDPDIGDERMEFNEKACDNQGQVVLPNPPIHRRVNNILPVEDDILPQSETSSDRQKKPSQDSVCYAEPKIPMNETSGDEMEQTLLSGQSNDSRPSNTSTQLSSKRQDCSEISGFPSKVNKEDTMIASQISTTTFVTGQKAADVINQLGSMETENSSLPGQSMFMAIPDKVSTAARECEDDTGNDVETTVKNECISNNTKSVPANNHRTLMDLAAYASEIISAETVSEISRRSSPSNIKEADNDQIVTGVADFDISNAVKAIPKNQPKSKRPADEAIVVFDTQSLPKQNIDDDLQEFISNGESGNKEDSPSPKQTPIKHTYKSRSATKPTLSMSKSKKRLREDEESVSSDEQKDAESCTRSRAKKKRLGAGPGQSSRSSSSKNDEAVAFESKKDAVEGSKVKILDDDNDDDLGKKVKAVTNENQVDGTSPDGELGHHPKPEKQRINSRNSNDACGDHEAKDSAHILDLMYLEVDGRKDNQPLKKPPNQKSKSQTKKVEKHTHNEEPSTTPRKSKPHRKSKAAETGETVDHQLTMEDENIKSNNSNSIKNSRKSRKAHIYSFSDDATPVATRGSAITQPESAANCSVKGSRKHKMSDFEQHIDNAPQVVDGHTMEEFEDGSIKATVQKQRNRKTFLRSDSGSSRLSMASSPRRKEEGQEDEEEVSVMFTGLDEKQIKKMSGLMDKLGWKHSRSWKDCTHLITTGVKRTSKFLSILGAGKRILATSWLEESAKAKHAVDEEAHAIKDVAHEKEWGFKLATSLKVATEQHSRGEGLFSGFSFFATPNVVPPKAELKDIIEAAGGKLMNALPKSGNEFLIVIASPEDTAEIKKAEKMGVTVVNKDFVIVSILRMRMMNRQEYRVE